MLKDKFNQFKSALSDKEFQKTVIQQVVKAVVVTTAIGITSAVLKYSDSSISGMFEKSKDAIAHVANPDLINE